MVINIGIAHRRTQANNPGTSGNGKNVNGFTYIFIGPCRNVDIAVSGQRCTRYIGRYIRLYRGHRNGATDAATQAGTKATH